MTRAGSGPPLLCLAGGPGFAAAHLGTLGGVDRHRTLLLVDVRGAGASDAPASRTWALDEYVEDVRAVQGLLEVDRVDVFGHSHGGFVASAYAARYPAAVARLILDGTPLRPRDLVPPQTGVAGYFSCWNDATQACASSLEALLFEDAANWFADNEWDAIDLEPVLARIEAPTLVISGRATGRAAR